MLTILVFSLFPVDHKMKTGGQSRLKAVLIELAKRKVKVHHVCLYGEYNTTRSRTILGGIKETWIPVEKERGRRILLQKFGASTEDASIGFNLHENQILQNFLAEEIRENSKVIVTHFWFSKVLEEKFKGETYYYSHNFESDFLEEQSQTLAFRNFYKDMERKSCKYFKHIACCSESDRKKFSNFIPFDNISICKNGSFLKQHKPKITVTHEELQCLFIGSHWKPNTDGLLELFRKNPDFFSIAKLHCIGSINKAFKNFETSNVKFHGILEDADIYKIACKCTFAINPVVYGGGSNVKNADYLALGLPILTTDFGSKGFEEFNSFLVEKDIQDWTPRLPFYKPSLDVSRSLNWEFTLTNFINLLIPEQ